MDTKFTVRMYNHSGNRPGTISVGEHHTLDPLGLFTSFQLFIAALGHNPKLLLWSGLFVLLSSFDLCLLPAVNSSVWGETKLSCGTRQPNLHWGSVVGGGERLQGQDSAGRVWGEAVPLSRAALQDWQIFGNIMDCGFTASFSCSHHSHFHEIHGSVLTSSQWRLCAATPTQQGQQERHFVVERFNWGHKIHWNQTLR